RGCVTVVTSRTGSWCTWTCTVISVMGAPKGGGGIGRGDGDGARRGKGQPMRAQGLSDGLAVALGIDQEVAGGPGDGHGVLRHQRRPSALGGRGPKARAKCG